MTWFKLYLCYQAHGVLMFSNKGKEKTDIQIFQTAMKEYVSSEDKNIPNLMLYASKLKMEDKVRLYTEVML